MESYRRKQDITPITKQIFSLTVDDKIVQSVLGETVLAVMLSTGKATLMENDHQANCGAYCGMGICHACHVKINGRYKQKACQTITEPNMQVYTRTNRFQDIGIGAGEQR